MLLAVKKNRERNDGVRLRLAGVVRQIRNEPIAAARGGPYGYSCSERKWRGVTEYTKLYLQLVRGLIR